METFLEKRCQTLESINFATVQKTPSAKMNRKNDGTKSMPPVLPLSLAEGLPYERYESRECTNSASTVWQHRTSQVRATEQTAAINVGRRTICCCTALRRRSLNAIAARMGICQSAVDEPHSPVAW
ncbi:PREDICTED: uncharacterized protein LOC108366812 [Rhagoletis zephyria]|uniref:uncharacterized protein LOC108366812 n=1 Tax=Rhagoletis zephyria TaxID=28612 RepID=UPI000811376F|nr:PREDICTED: uncharacterized protein LOC108366812 [Rhagoletis zephyria]